MSTVILNSQLLLCRCDAHDVFQLDSSHNYVVLDAVRLVDNSGFRVQQVTRARRSHILRNRLLVNQLAVHHVDAFGVVDDAVEVFRALAAVFNQAVAGAVVLVVVFLRFEALHSSSVVSVGAFCFATHLVPVDVAARVVKQLDAGRSDFEDGQVLVFGSKRHRSDLRDASERSTVDILQQGLDVRCSDTRAVLLGGDCSEGLLKFNFART